MAKMILSIEATRSGYHNTSPVVSLLSHLRTASGETPNLFLNAVLKFADCSLFPQEILSSAVGP